MNCGKKIPDTLILVIYLPPAMLFFSFFKKIPDMLILVIYLPPAMLFLISQKQGVAAKASAVGFCLGCGLFGSYNSL